MSLAALRRNFALPLGILLILAFQGLFDTAPALFCVASSPVTASDAHKEHSKYCHCKDCSGAKNLKKCCCVKAKTGAQSLAFVAVCDTPKDMLQAAEQSPRAVSAPIVVAVVLLCTILAGTLFSCRLDAHGLSPKPSLLPPRFL